MAIPYGTEDGKLHPEVGAIGGRKIAGEGIEMSDGQ